MLEEMSALDKNNTWELVQLPKGKTVVGCKWVFSVKQNSQGLVERYKARIEAYMETEKPLPPPTTRSSLTRTVTKILRLRRTASRSGFAADIDNKNLKLKLSDNPSGLTNSHTSNDGKPKDHPQPEASGSLSSDGLELDADSLLANIFTGVSAIKAAYAQLQVAESPYDPDAIQASDQAVVSELKHLSSMKYSYLKKQVKSPADSQVVPPELQEQRNLLKTYQITAGKLESGLRHMDAELHSLQAQLTDLESHNQSLQSHLCSDFIGLRGDLRPSLPDSKQFIAVLRSAAKSVRHFVKRMVIEMESAGWDLDTAAAAIQPDVRGKPEHRIHAFESFVCRSMFSHFQHRNFGISSLERRSSLDRRTFFQEFLELNSAKPAPAGSELGRFVQSKYLSLVHPKMEASFFGDLDRRTAISFGLWLPDSEFSAAFAEMAKRVWLLHCLYFSFGPEMEAAIFQVKRGCRFSEVYMDSVAASPANFPVSSSEGLTVKFSVVPGFRVGKTLIQCKVYLSKQG
ncbi:hypothetical protein KSP39_PZI005721 [Platanthera zijinensis]|uniref:DUF641 domain-containing protein n=1 Tax=Platanthera zijinensis TaxID=2320716 RepID=A0AAP0BRW0_9ASPA